MTDPTIIPDPTPSSTNIFGLPLTPTKGLPHPALPDGVAPEVMEKYGNPFVAEYPIGAGDELHKSACIICLPEGQPQISADEFAEQLMKKHAPEFAFGGPKGPNARPTPKSLLSGKGALRRPRDSQRQVALRETKPLTVVHTKEELDAVIAEAEGDPDE